MVKNPLSRGDASPLTGQDCTSIEGVHAVSCVSGRCAVTSCNDGWVVDAKGDSCSQDRTSAATALNVAAGAMKYSLGSRSPLKARPEPKDESKPEIRDIVTPGHEGEGSKEHSNYYGAAYYA